MKSGNTYRTRGKHFPPMLIILVLITVCIWSFKRKPPSTTMFSFPGHLDLPGSEVTFAARDIKEPNYHAVQENREDIHLYEETGVESGLDVNSSLIIQENEADTTTDHAGNGNDSSEEAYSKMDVGPDLSSDDDRGTEFEIRSFDGSDADSSQQNGSDSTSFLDNTDMKESYLKQKKLDYSDMDKGIEFEIRSFDDSDADSSQKNGSESTSFLENNDLKEAYPKPKKADFSVKGKGSQFETPTGDGSYSTPLISSRIEDSIRGSKSSIHNKSKEDAKSCKYAKGMWVKDKNRPLYSGFKCKQWLSDMWACRLTERPDFSYESYRWQPENCEMPMFDRLKFLARMQDKTIAFIGDSLGRQQFQSLMCMVTGGEEDFEVQDTGNRYGFFVEPGSVRPNGWAFRFLETNTTVLFYWSATLCDLEPLNATDPRTQVAMHLDRPPSFLQKFLPQLNVIILNTGHHWNRGKVNSNRWVMYAGGKPVKDRKLAMVGNAKNFAIRSVTRWLDNEVKKHPQVKAFFRTISPRHFFNGDWNTGGSCENTTPLANGSAVLQDESSDPVTAGAVKGTRVRLLDITALSGLRDEGHISRYGIKSSQGIQDCLHWCLPGIPDTWNEIVAAQV